MLWKLTMLRFRSAFDRTAVRGRKKAMVLLTGFLLLYVGAAIAAMMYLLFSTLCEPFTQLGLDWFYFSLAGLLAFTLSFVTSILSAQAQLYEARDNELLLSMPIAPGIILGSRMLYLWLLNFATTTLVLLPAAVAYGLTVGIGIGEGLALVLVCLSLPGLSLACTALIGWGTANLTSRMGRYKTVVTMVFTVAFLAAYLYVYSQLQQILTRLITQAQALAHGFRAVFPVYHLGLALAEGSPTSLLVTLAVCWIPLALTCWLLSRNFIAIVTRKRGHVKISYQGGPMEVRSLDRALLTRELRRLANSSVYMMNSGMGLLMLVLMTVAAAWQRETLVQVLALLPLSPAVLAALAMCIMSAMVLFTAPSVSLEGKTLWLLQSMPVHPRAVLQAKVRMHLLLSLPVVLLCTPALCWILGVSPSLWLPVLLLCLAFHWYTACAGLVCNLLFPKLDWISETVAVKQGISVLLAMLASMAGALLVYAGSLLNLPDLALLLGAAVLFAFLSLLLTRWLATRGVQRFASL